jgi:GT2 family glycosyltransferase
MGKAPLVLLLTDDVLLSETAVDRMLETMKDDSIGMLGIKLLFPDDSVDPNRPAGKVQHIGLSMDVEANVIHPLVGWSADNPKCCVSRDVFGVTGACFVIRRELFNRAGGFDEDYGLGTYEDVSLSLSVKAQGKRVYLDTDIIGHHHVGATAQKKNLGFPLQQNANIFKAKWSQSGLFLYDSYKYY